MEWVETTGRTLDEAKDLALDQLGVDEIDAEFEVVDEPRTGLFGRLRGEARVRARIAPRVQRPKQERQRRRTKAEGRPAKEPRAKKEPATPAKARTKAKAAPNGAGDETEAESPAAAPAKRTRAKARPQPDVIAKDDAGPAAHVEKGTTVDETVTVEQQAEIMEAFLGGLLEAFGAEGTITTHPIDDETIELHVDGDDLGLLIGPKGQTLQAVQDLARTVVQRRAAGPHEGRVRIDIGGYRERRREALGRFTTQVADEVKASGVRKALEPMGPADRKIIHDTVNDIEGVETVSEGEEPRRWVVILPAEG